MERLEAIRKKEKHEESAVASTEVKQKLQGFLLKKQREQAAAMGSGTITTGVVPPNTTGSGGVGNLNPPNAPTPGNTKIIDLYIFYVSVFH